MWGQLVQESLAEDLGVPARGTRCGFGVTGWSVEVEGWGLGVVGLSGLGILTEDLCALPSCHSCELRGNRLVCGDIGFQGFDRRPLCPARGPEVGLGVTGLSVEVDGYSATAVGTTDGEQLHQRNYVSCSERPQIWVQGQ